MPECISTFVQVGVKSSGWGSIGVVRKVLIESGLLWNTRPKLLWKLCPGNYDISVLSIGSWCFGWWNPRNKSQEGTCAKLPTNTDHMTIICQYVIWFVCILCHISCKFRNVLHWHCRPDLITNPTHIPYLLCLQCTDCLQENMWWKNLKTRLIRPQRSAHVHCMRGVLLALLMSIVNQIFAQCLFVQ